MFGTWTRIPAGAKPRAKALLAATAGTALLAGTSALIWPATPAEAHCDSVNGPVVVAAREALATGNVNLVLPYVKPDAEEELTAAFAQAREARGDGEAAQGLADRWFSETAVRLHRAGEGAPYTGLREQADFGPALEAAEQAVASGSPDEVYAVLNKTVEEGVAERAAEMRAAQAAAEQEGTVAAHRERVERELEFETYVNAIYEAAQNPPTAAEGGHADAPAAEGAPAASHQ